MFYTLNFDILVHHKPDNVKKNHQNLQNNLLFIEKEILKIDPKQNHSILLSKIRLNN